MYFCQPKSTKRPCANDAPPRSEKTAKILRTVALEGRDGLLLRPASRIFCCFFIHPGAARRSREAHAPDPVVVGSVFGVILFIFRSFPFQNHCLPHQCFAFIPKPILSIYGDLLQLCSYTEFFCKVNGFQQSLQDTFGGRVH